MNDFLLSIIGLLFSYSLIPTIIESYKNKKVGINKQTIVISCCGLYIMVIIYLDLCLYFAAITNFITASCWGILGILKFKESGS